MPFQVASKDDLVALVNAKNSTAFTVADFDYSNPRVVAGSWQEELTDKNTAVRLLASEASIYQGNVIVLYDRLSLNSLAQISGWRVSADEPATTHDLIDAIAIYTGIRFTTDDIEDLAITLDGTGAGTAVISAKPNSLGWIGNVNLPVTKGGALLDDQITTPLLEGLNYPSASDADTYAEIYTYGYDFTSYTEQLIDLEEGTELTGTDLTAVRDMLAAVDISSGKTLWNTDAGSTTWSLAGAQIVKNGLNSPTLPTNPNYKYVLGLQLRGDLTVPKGTLYMHYNDPFDPNDF
jgi:hypothetical protein